MKHYKIAFLVLINLLVFNTIAQPKIDVENVWLEYQFFPNRVEGFRSMNDGVHYTKIETDYVKQDVVRYSILDQGSAIDTILKGEQLIYAGKQLRIDDYEFNEDETKMLLTVNQKKKYRRSFYADYFLYDIKTKKIEPLDAERSPQTLASYSPDGTQVAYIFNNDLWVKDLKSGAAIQLTKDGEENKIINGTTDWVYEEEFAITKAYEWSPKGDYIAFLRFDESEVLEFTMNYYHEAYLYPEPYTFKYPKAGEDNSVVELKVVKIDNKETKTIDLGAYEYIPRIKFSSVENKLMALTLNRHQNHIKYHWVDIDKETMPAKVVYQEKDDAYVEVDDNLYFLQNGKEFIRTSEKDGYNHIYIINVNGSVKQITKGDWDVISFEGIDEKKGVIYYMSAEEGPQYASLYSIKLNGKQKKKISTKKGVNDVSFTKGMKYYINQWSNLNTPPVYSLHSADGKELRELENNAGLKERMEAFNFQDIEFIEVDGRDQKLNAWILYPPNFDKTKEYPVYFYVYGGPGHNTVRDFYDGGNGGYHQLLAQQGYIVISVDPRGTYYRGAKFKKSTYLNLGKLETEDLIAVAKNIGKWDFVDKDRIGIMGWSYGGYMASLAMTKGAPYFKMGIAIAPVTTWRYYDNIYTERFMRTPNENISGYDDNSPIHFADLLEGNYLIVHGDSDDNVHVQNTMEMINALVAADKQFEMFIYPNRNHGIYGGNTRNHLYQMLLNFTLKNL